MDHCYFVIEAVMFLHFWRRAFVFERFTPKTPKSRDKIYFHSTPNPLAIPNVAIDSQDSRPTRFSFPCTNDHKKDLDNARQNLGESIEMENYNLTVENIKNIPQGNRTNSDLSFHDNTKPHLNNKTIEDSSAVASTRESIELDNQRSGHTEAVKTESQGIIDEGLTACEAVDGRSESDSNIGSETADPEVLAHDVTKLNISTEEKKPKETHSKVVVNRQTESLTSLMAYDGDSDSENSDTEPQAEVWELNSGDEHNVTKTKKTWRKNGENDSDTSDSESDSSASTLSLESDSDRENSDGNSASVIDASDDGMRADNKTSVLEKPSDKRAVKKKNTNIFDMEEFLPPLPDLSKLNINVDEAEFMHIGRISAIISELVTVSVIAGTPTFDLDSMLFIDDQTSKKPIGPIFDVIGPVAEPIYCVRFNNEKEITDIGLKAGMKVYAIPKSEEFTKYVFVQELMKMRGSDASWFHDNETPSELAEFSDDEKEREARRAKKINMKRKLNDGSLERHKRYERTMNQCNTLNTRVCRLMDAHKNFSKHIRPSTDTDIKQPPDCPELPPVPPALFDPTVPPPGFGQSRFHSIATPSPYFNTSPGFGQSAMFNNSLSPYNNQSGVQSSLFGSPVMFGNHYENENPSPQNLCPPPARWNSLRQEYRRPHRPSNPWSNQQNSDNYFTNNSRNFRGPGPSSQPF